MAESHVLSVVKIWAAVAWADGMLADTEKDGMHRLIAAADLSPADRATATAFLRDRIELPDVQLTKLSPESRRGIYRAACRMAIVDHVFAHAERKMLDRLRDTLGIPADIAGEIEADVPGMAI